MIIDIHTHTFPDHIAAAALRKMQGDSHSQTFSDGTVQGLKQSMKDSGIDLSVVLPVATNPTKVSRINDLSIELTNHDGLIYFGCIHPDTEDWHQELSRIADAGIKGIKIHPVYQGADIDDIRFLRILDRAGELGLIVLMHSGDDIGFPGVVRCSPQMTLSALQQVGKVKLIMAHMGGWRNWAEAEDLLAETDVFLDTAFSIGEIPPLEKDYYTKEQLQLLSQQDFCRMVRTFGAERILFGTDSPWSDQAQGVRTIRQLPLSETEKNAILGGNAQKLLNL